MERDDFNTELGCRLEALREQGLYRELRQIDSPAATRIEIDGRTLLNFSANDYLGFANHPALKEAAIQAVQDFGAGTGASRLICGSLAPHHLLEEKLASFKGTEAALSFSSGYATAVGTICALLSKDDVIVIDKLVHACIVDAAKLSGAKLRVFEHNNLDDLEKILQWADQRNVDAEAKSRSRVLIVTESVFSMDGDFAPLAELVALKEKYGAWLMVDEAHGAGVFGQNGRGMAEQVGVSGKIEIQMGTLGKAIGASGGYIAGSKKLVDYLVNRARTFIFSTAPTPATAAAATAGIELAGSAEGSQRRKQLFSLIEHLQKSLIQMGWNTDKHRSPIIPLIIGAETDAVNAATALRAQGIFIPAIRYPTVARGTARLRLTLTAAHKPEDLSLLQSQLAALRQSSNVHHA